MIEDFDSPHSLEPEHKERMQWGAALGAGLVAGLVLLVVPRGSPWSSMTFFAPAVMGRVVPGDAGIGFVMALMIHMGVALLYGLIISRIVQAVTQLKALVVGGLVGLALYLVNYLIVSAVFPVLQGHEVSVVFTHGVFGCIAGGAYRGLLQRRARGTLGADAGQVNG